MYYIVYCNTTTTVFATPAGMLVIVLCHTSILIKVVYARYKFDPIDFVPDATRHGHRILLYHYYHCCYYYYCCMFSVGTASV